MREFEVTYKNERLNATKSTDGNFLLNIPSAEGNYTRILNSSVGWLFTTFDIGSDYFFEVWLRPDGRLGWRNDLSHKDTITSEPYNPKFENAGLLNDVARELYSVVRQFYGYQTFGVSPITIVDLKKDLNQIVNSLDGNTKLSKQIKEKVEAFAPFIKGGVKSDKTEGVGFYIPEDFSKEHFLREYQRMMTIREKYKDLIKPREKEKIDIEHK